jgi:tetratricopeptide (TPR) repeat protein
MKATNDLHKLIKSLSKTEKTYFKKFAVRHNSKENNTFLRLFNAFEVKKDDIRYNENDIKKKFKNEKFIRQLPVIKNYLYNTILKSLNLYYLEEKINIKLNFYLNSANLLLDKELYNESLKILAKAEKLAEENEMDAELLQIINIKRKVLRIKTSLNEAVGEIMETYNEEKKVLEKISNILGYKKLYDEMVIYASSKGLTKNKEEQKELLRIKNDPLLSDYSNATNTHSRVLYHQMLGIITRFLNDIEGTYYHHKKLIELVDNEPSKKKIFAAYYLLTKQNLIVPAMTLGKTDEPKQLCDELLKGQDALLIYLPGKVKRFVELRTYTIIAGIHMHNGDFDKATPLLEKVVKLAENNRYRDEDVVANHLSAVNYFALGELNRSLKHLNAIFNSKTFMLRTDIQSSSRIFSLILHYELGNIDSLEYFLKSTYRFLRKMKNLLRFEMLTLKIIKKLTKISNNKELVELLKEHRDELEEIFFDPQESERLHGFDIIAWVDSKLQDKTYREIIRAKVKESHRESKID